MRMIVFNDPHFSARPPASRTGEYCTCMLRKLRETVEFANVQKADLLACTGDWFISKNPESTPHWLQALIYDILFEFHGKVLSVVGNHDCKFIASLNQSPLYMILQALGGNYDPDSGVIYADYSKSLEIVAVNFDKGCSTNGYWEVAKSFAKSTTRRILVAHGPIVSVGFSGMYPPQFVEKMVQAQDLVGCADIIFYGDIHDYHGIYTLANAESKTTFCNLGSLSRNTVKEMDKDRPVLIALYDTETGVISPCELEDVDPPEKAFRFAEIVAERENDEKIDRFVDALDQSGLSFTILTKDVLHARIEGEPSLSVNEKHIAIRAVDVAN